MKLACALLCVQTVILLLYTQVNYDSETGLLVDGTDKATPSLLAKTINYYGVFMDVHVMIFIGFGYLMTFLAYHGYGSVGFNFLVAALTMEWAMVIVPVVHNVFAGHAPFKELSIDTVMLIEGDFGAAAVLITFGGLLGKVGPLQLIIVGLIEIVVYAINYNIVAVEIGTLDVGGSLVIHAFGAYFGLACSYVITKKKAFDHPKNTSTRTSDLFAMIGTVFLWIYWPSFVSALVPDARERCALHTVLALCGSCVCGFLASFKIEGKLDMVHIQNATLAGGVAIGSVADMNLGPCASMAIGCVAGLWSVFGYAVLSPMLESKWSLHDTCGIHNLHGMPGLLGGIASVFAIALGRGKVLGVPEEDNAKQAWKQVWGMLVTLAFGLVGGYLTGLLVKEPVFDIPQDEFEDKCFWETPEEEKQSDVPAEERPPPSILKIAIPIILVQICVFIVYLPQVSDVGYHFRNIGSDVWDLSSDMIDAQGGKLNLKTAMSYGVWMDVHVMIFIGFGFLMTFLYRHGFGSIGFNLFIAAVCMEWAMVVVPAVHNIGQKHSIFDNVKLDTIMLIEGDFAAAAVLITFGGLLGKVGPVQLLIVGLLEVIIYAINYNVVAVEIGALDVGGSLVIHTFGAYFGLAASFMLTSPSQISHSKNKASYSSDLFAMIGTVFLWIYWPSFVSALVPYGRERAALHTVLALCASCVCAFAASVILTGKLDMVHVQNATLAGGVAIGAVADFEIGFAVAILIGSVAGLWSTFGYVKISPLLENIRVHDTCGIHNLHGMPGLISGIASIFAVLVGDAGLLGVADSDKGSQAAKQAYGLLATMAFAIGGGLVVGLIAKLYGEADFAAFEDAYWWTTDWVSSGAVENGGSMSAVCPEPALPAPGHPGMPRSITPPTGKAPALPEAEAVEAGGTRHHRAFVACAAMTQLTILGFYLIFATYGEVITSPPEATDALKLSGGIASPALTENHYGVFMDVHVMIFIGFGYLMTFLKSQGFGSVGFNFLVAALAMEWAMVVVPMVAHGFHGHGATLFDRVHLDSVMLIEGDFAAAAVLITFGGLLGKVGPLHLLVVGLLEVIVYAINFEVVAKVGTLDVGGSLVIHAFGAYFGLAASYVLTPARAYGHTKNGSSYNSDIFAMIGTVFLWIYWPSFVSALVPEAREVAAVHTVLALCGSCVIAFGASYFFEGRFDMVHIQNATLAGGVAIGAAADMDIGLATSLAIGCIAGFWSTFGYVRITPLLDNLGIHDTCGIHNLHGMPGLIGGFASVVAVAAGKAKHLQEPEVTKGDQAGKQILGLIAAVAIALVGGLLTGFIAKIVCPPLQELFEDGEFWTVDDGSAKLAFDGKDGKVYADSVNGAPHEERPHADSSTGGCKQPSDDIVRQKSPEQQSPRHPLADDVVRQKSPPQTPEAGPSPAPRRDPEDVLVLSAQESPREEVLVLSSPKDAPKQAECVYISQ